MTAPTLAFLPRFRQGLSSGAETSTRTIGVDIASYAGDSPATHHVEPKALELLRPEDILGIDDAMIARVYPAPGTAELKFNLFPFVEFKDADFLWRYSYAKLDADHPQLRPWLLLVVLERSRCVVSQASAEGKQPRAVTYLKTTSGDLDLTALRASSWAWAHVQLTQLAALSRSELQAMLAGEQSELVLSRLVAPVKLAPETSYRAFVVPAERGPVNPAGWPVFYAWDFRTAATADLESLFKRIIPGEVPDCRLSIDGVEYIDFARDPFTAQLADHKVFPMHAALAPAGDGALDEPAVTRGQLASLEQRYRESFTELQACPFRDGARRCAQTAAYAGAVVTCTGGTEPAHPPTEMVRIDPYVGYPIYGGYHAPGVVPAAAIDPAAGPAAAAAIAPAALPWLYEVNLSTRARIAAGLGAEVVRRNQEELADYCWNHRDELEEQDRAAAQRALAVAQRQLAALLNVGLLDRHYPQAPQPDAPPEESAARAAQRSLGCCRPRSR